MKRNYHTVDNQGKVNERKLSEFLARNGQMLLPMVQLVEQARLAVDEVIDVVGRKTLEAVLWLSASQVAGAPQQGRKRQGDIFWHGTQRGSVYLKERKLGVNKPRLRKKVAGEEGEVAIPAYQAMQDRAGLGARMLEIVLQGVSTRGYAGVIPALAETVGVSKSSVSRETIAASEAELKQLLNRRLDELAWLILYIDGMRFGEQWVIAAVGVDEKGHKHVLGLQEGATENAAAAQSLLEDLVARGLDPGRRRLFVIDGSKALRAAINAVFGAQGLVQRCRNHKLRNVVERLPKEQQNQARALIRAAWKLDAPTGMAKLEKLAQWLEREHPDAAASLREGMEECFTINRLDVPPSLHRCLASTNIIESPNGGVRRRTRKVCYWKDKTMAKRWAAAAYLRTERNFRCIMGYKDLWALKAILDGNVEKPVTAKEKVA